MPRIGTSLSTSATRVLLCGSGELGKELVVELQRLGVEVVAVDRYANAPAAEVADRHPGIDMRAGPPSVLRWGIGSKGVTIRSRGSRNR